MDFSDLTHLNENGKVQMVNIGEKPDTRRTAVACGEVHLRPETLNLVKQGLIKKGDVFAVAQIAGIMAAKRTSELIPLCHPIDLHQVSVDLEVNDEKSCVIITAKTYTSGKTGVEMEALTAVSVAALTIYDMVKAVEKTGRIQNIRLIEKHGGLSGDVHNA